jgi:hypothetical protein
VSGLVDPVCTDGTCGRLGTLSLQFWTGSQVSRIWASSNTVSVFSQSNLARIGVHWPSLIGGACSLDASRRTTSAARISSLSALGGITRNPSGAPILLCYRDRVKISTNNNHPTKNFFPNTSQVEALSPIKWFHF